MEHATRWNEADPSFPSLGGQQERVLHARDTALEPASPNQEKNDLEHRLYSRSTASLWKLAGCTEIDWLQVGGMRGGDHPQVLEWLLDAVTRMKPRPCSSIFPGRRRRLLEERNVDRSWTTTIVAIL